MLDPSEPASSNRRAAPDKTGTVSPAGQQSMVRLAGAAGIIGAGNVVSRLLGLVRETVIAHLFAASPYVSAFRVAAQVPTMIFDLLIGGMLSSALVPVFSEYFAPKNRRELWRLASVVFSLALVALTGIVILLELLAPVVAWILGGGFEPEVMAATTRLIRVVLPAVILFGVSGVLTGLLYSLQRFTFPAFGSALYNIGAIFAAVLFARSIDIYALAIGIMLGAVLQLGLLLPGLKDARLKFELDLQHPALRRIVRLYLPIVLGLIVSNIGIAIDRNLASHTGGQSIAWMQYATNLMQFPLGLVAAAVSLAALPSMTQRHVSLDEAGYRGTLMTGLRLVTVLIIPATVGMFLLARPIVALVFQHGKFSPDDTQRVAQALRFYLIGLTPAALDQLLIFAYYARKNTLTPALVGVAAVGVYLTVALSLRSRYGMIGLVVASSAQWTAHTIIMMMLLRRTLDWRSLGEAGGKALLASGGMGVASYLGARWIEGLLGGEGLLPLFETVAGAALIGIAIYALMVRLLRVGELQMIEDRVARRLGFARFD